MADEAAQPVPRSPIRTYNQPGFLPQSHREGASLPGEQRLANTDKQSSRLTLPVPVSVTLARVLLTTSLCLLPPTELTAQEVATEMSNIPSPPPGVMAAPNRVGILANVISCRAAEGIPGKLILEVQFERSDSIQGPNFARTGERASAFTFVDADTAEALKGLADKQGRVSAEAEFIGGPGGGTFQLYDPKAQD